MFWARICVKNSKDELPKNLELIKEGWVFEISLLEHYFAKIRPVGAPSFGGAKGLQAEAGTSSLAPKAAVTHVVPVDNEGSGSNITIKKLGLETDRSYYKKGPKRKAQVKESKLLKEKTIWNVVGHKPNPYVNKFNALVVPLSTLKKLRHRSPQ